MSDTIGRITVADLPHSSQAFPLRTDFAHSRTIKRQVIAHTFGAGEAKVEQRFFVGTPAARYTFRRTTLSNSARLALAEFWSARVGCATFDYDVPQPDQTFITKTVAFEDAPLTLEDLAGSICAAGVTFVEVPDPDLAPVYVSQGTPLERFPDDALADSLAEEVQELIPLVRIRVLDAGVDDIYLSDRRVTVDDQLYLPRLLRIGEAGSEVLMSQSIDGSSDEVQFAFGNADRAMIDLANDTELKDARIELSVYHVDSGILIGLWAGKIVDWSSDKGPEFAIQASDVLSALTISSPVGKCGRACYRRYAQDGCPATLGTQDLDSTNFPTADASTCDLGYETANGCLAHSGGTNPTKYSYGAVWAKPQQVLIKDNSTGMWGIARGLITPTSQINDSLWGQTLPEIWHRDDGYPERALPVNCRIAAGREESDFYIALGVVGKGPLGAFSVATMVDADGDGQKETFIGSTLDGQPHHGWKVDDSGNPSGTSLGLRQCLGTDPAGTSDWFSLGRVGSVPANWREVTNGTSCYEDTYAAGVAFCEIRRVDEKGVQLSTPQSHSMIAMISQGLAGWTWSGATRSSIGGLTNPFWVAVNTFLRALGLASEDSTTQLAQFDATAAATAAATADAVVASLFGSGTEKQFRFKGVLDARKPTRDWLRDIVNNGLGYFTWSFGKLKLGCRNSATPVTTFNAGNMLFGSLRLEPLKPAFEKLTVEFADEEYQFAQNTVDYTDQDYAGRLGRAPNPAESPFGLVGCSTKSQAARLAVIRTREELGGVGATEQKAARVASWRTTIMALDTEAGMVVDLEDDDLPGGAGAFRIQSWRLNRDWSVDIVGRTVTASMYDLSVGVAPVVIVDAAKPPSGLRDTGAPPEPDFAIRASLTDPASLEIYALSFAQTTNTRTIASATFTITFASGAADRVVTASFPPDFFSSAAASDWSLKVYLPGMTVASVAGFVANRYGASPVHTETATIALADSALTAGPTSEGHVAVFDAEGKLIDSGEVLLHGFIATVYSDDATFYFPAAAFAGTICRWKIATAKSDGSAVTGTVKIWKSSSDVPSAGDSISTAGISISGAKDITSTTLTDFTSVAIAVGDRVAIHLESGTDPVTVQVEYS